MRRGIQSVGLVVTVLGTTACYHFTFEQHAPGASLTSAGQAEHPLRRTVTHEERVPTYLNGFVGEGRIETAKYCNEPVRTELRVTASDVALSLVTLLVYTPHTLYVTCDEELTATPR